MENPWECIIIGGGAAGLSAALVLGRARRRTLVVDAGEPSNGVAEGIGGLLGHDRQPPESLYRTGREELAAYPSVEMRSGRVVAASGPAGDGESFHLELDDGSRERAPRLLLATGMQYRMPDLPGIAERWGRSVFHCPFCHGWEVRDRPIAVLDGGPTGVQRALLLRLWSDDVTLLTNGDGADLGADERTRLEREGVIVDEREVVELRGPGDELEAVVFADGGERRCEGLLVPVTLHQRSTLASDLGALTEAGPIAADALVIDSMFRTSVPGLFAAGDIGAQMPSVAGAVASGSAAARTIVHDLLVAA
ncbi:MAG: Thioredoxin reductase [uncultured Acidimicrobiales bacterium]|uniref:Thioredoxin reductase n=1 Tax=uncultured Acidimicrobiales bacterium TaxID=310071 RepID=A0A6J4HX14_9ACTN|nr:MAG: Thioredoxin reductase [uncultured Acidimicrobiales bacterium]